MKTISVCGILIVSLIVVFPIAGAYASADAMGT